MSNPPPLPPGMPPFRPIGHPVSAVREDCSLSESDPINRSTHLPGPQPLGIPGLGRHRGSAEGEAGRETTGVGSAGGQNRRQGYDVVFSQRPGEVGNEAGEGVEGARVDEHRVDYDNNNDDEDDSLFGGGSDEESGGMERDGPIEENNSIESAGNNENYQGGTNERNNDNNCEDEKEKVVDSTLFTTRSSAWESEASHRPADTPFHGLTDPRPEAAESPTTGKKMLLPRNSEENWPDNESMKGPTTSCRTPPATIPDQGDHKEDHGPANRTTTGGKGIHVTPDSESVGSSDKDTGTRKYSGQTVTTNPNTNENEAERVTRPNVACGFIGLDEACLPGRDRDDHDAEVEGGEEEEQEDSIDAEVENEAEPASAKAKPSSKKPATKDGAETYVAEISGAEPEPANTNKRKKATMMRVSPQQEEEAEEKEDDALPSPKKKTKARAKGSRTQNLDGKIRCIYIKPAKGKKPAEQCGNWFYPKGSLYCHATTHVAGPAAAGGAGGAGGGDAGGMAAAASTARA